jgi:alpha-ketoglutarate-dependent taurine dioxygenase
MSVQVETIKPGIGGIVHATKADMQDEAFVKECLQLLEKHGMLMFPKIGLTDQEQLAFNDKLGARLNFTKTVSGSGASAEDVYTVTLDPEINSEPEYVIGTFFWHLDGVTIDQPPPKFSVLSARKTAPQGGQTGFCNTYSSYEALPEETKKEIENLRVVHSVTAAVREVASPEELEPFKRSFHQEHPLVWTRKNGRKSLLIGYSADYIVGMPKAYGRALLARLLEWTAQPAFSYDHTWSEGDLAVWDNGGLLHRVIPYAADSGRRMHRTSVAGLERTEQRVPA